MLSLRLLTGLALLLPTLAQAQPALPPSDDPGRIEQNLPPIAPPPPSDDLVIPATEDRTPPAHADAIQFHLESLVIEGVTVYSPQELEVFYRHLIGREITLRTLYDIANQLSAQYRQDDYVLSRVVVPAQTVEGGEVRLQAIEGYIEGVDLPDSSLPSGLQQRILDYSNPLSQEQPLRLSTLERSLLLINDLPGVTLASTLSPGTETGATRLRLTPRYEAINAALGMNNQGSATLGPLRAQGGIFLNSLVLGTGEQLSLTGGTTPAEVSQLTSFALGLDVPTGPDGLQFTSRFAYTHIRPGGALSVFSIDGETYRGSLGLSYPLQRSRRQNIILRGSLEASSRTTRTTLLGSPIMLSQDQQVVARLAAQINRQDASGIWWGDLELSQGLGGSPDAVDRPRSRAEGRLGFTSLRAEITRRQFLSAGFNLELGATGQIASSSLLVGEQFGLGGNRFGRGFIASEVLGDAGYGLRAELQRPFGYVLAGSPMVTQPYLFYDYGQVFRYRPTVVENATDSLSSAGVGLRHSIGSWLLADLTLAFPLSRTDTPLANNAPRFFFNLQAFF